MKRSSAVNPSLLFLSVPCTFKSISQVIILGVFLIFSSPAWTTTLTDPELSLGTRVRVQMLLKKYGYYEEGKEAIDGIIGTDTKSAFREFNKEELNGTGLTLLAAFWERLYVEEYVSHEELKNKLEKLTKKLEEKLEEKLKEKSEEKLEEKGASSTSSGGVSVSENAENIRANNDKIFSSQSIIWSTLFSVLVPLVFGIIGAYLTLRKRMTDLVQSHIKKDSIEKSEVIKVLKHDLADLKNTSKKTSKSMDGFLNGLKNILNNPS